VFASGASRRPPGLGLFGPRDFEDEAYSVTPSCTLVAEQEEGPYYLDLDKVRKNITEGKSGVRLDLRIKIVDSTSCDPLKDVAVDIWHCAANGKYSGVLGRGDLRRDVPGQALALQQPNDHAHAQQRRPRLRPGARLELGAEPHRAQEGLHPQRVRRQDHPRRGPRRHAGRGRLNAQPRGAQA
jgi:hypothetical protein